ncbi:MAG: hypothetical protein HND43_01955 [Armatimonadetes bacterium]|uniref:Uncharacterized protein n=1 Tax=Candidatus Nitrosymbiomonas proteolyticus TaxID=2608984 RepID=A0A809SEQ5_9BACT|nr:MAG: hypothetical protein UZ18_ATM001002173 [Armatimonadetes bacterium OLB18]MBL1151487.1 hypothetical protein [Armatimonadota bacterium]MBV6490013.1 hypothetical protein [Fimbriimonadaceae bacterium]QOJ12240.1 MAG: hypothetical protein HRU74_09340 [Chthonomonadaceae bacterium]BBO24124.1 conserved hypothetical protein [Candidatus Nitrosymbiomonas proteolyticus]
MADPRDIEATKYARREFIKHRLDVTMAEIRVSHGVVYIRGIVRRDPQAHYDNVSNETERVGRLLKQRPEIRDVVVEAKFL